MKPAAPTVNAYNWMRQQITPANHNRDRKTASSVFRQCLRDLAPSANALG
jgi:hypothetical protein